MKERNIFIGILIIVLIAIGVLLYRTVYRGEERPVQIAPIAGEQ